MLSWLFNRKKQQQRDEEVYFQHEQRNGNWAFLGFDMHSHFLPGIDDGAKTVEDSLALVRAMIDMGYKGIITTPHVFVDYYPNTTETINNALQLVKDAMKVNNLDIPIRAAAEYYIDESFMRLIDEQPLLTVFGKQVLVEFSMMYEPPMLKEAIFKLQTAGYTPIIAHPERYLSFHTDMRKYKDLKDRGCLLQLNMMSITGYYGKNVKTVADELLAKGMYDYCGSDAHHEKHLGVLKGMTRSRAYDRFIGYPFLNDKLFI